jgi:PTH1 family peptidyl-tRNA hydrolase
MNLSGRCIRKLCDYYKIEYQKLIILTDDTNIDFGKIRIRKEGSAGGHNGLKSIISCLGVDKFARVRLGVGDKGNSKLDHYVLSEFNSEEKKILSEIISKAADAVETIINENIDTAMNKFN